MGEGYIEPCDAKISVLTVIILFYETNIPDWYCQYSWQISKDAIKKKLNLGQNRDMAQSFPPPHYNEA